MREKSEAQDTLKSLKKYLAMKLDHTLKSLSLKVFHFFTIVKTHRKSNPTILILFMYSNFKYMRKQ